MGRFKKGGVPNVEAAAKDLLEDWNRLVLYLCLTLYFYNVFLVVK